MWGISDLLTRLPRRLLAGGSGQCLHSIRSCRSSREEELEADPDLCRSPFAARSVLILDDLVEKVEQQFHHSELGGNVQEILLGSQVKC